MRRAQGRGQPERRSTRLSKTRRIREVEKPSVSQIPRTYSASGSEGELVVVYHKGDTLGTRELDWHSTLDWSSLGRAEGSEGIEGTDPSSSSKDSDNMPTTTRLKYSRLKGDGSQDVDEWFCKYESIALANQKENEAKVRIFQGLQKDEALKWYQEVPDWTRNNWE